MQQAYKEGPTLDSLIQNGKNSFEVQKLIKIKEFGD